MIHMEGETAELPSAVRRLEAGGKVVYLVGTAHISQQSVRDVRQTIERLRPQTVCLELDEGRYRNLVDEERWRKTNIGKIIREGKAALLLSSLLMASFQRRLGKKLGLTPGAELVEGARAAEEVGAQVVLVDRDIQVTLKRTWGNLGWRDKLKMATQLAGSLFACQEIDAQTVEQLKQDDMLADVLQMMAREFPALKTPLIDERDTYMAQKILAASGPLVVAVVGAGHVPGLQRELQRQTSLEPLEAVPEPSWLFQALKWGIPALILGLMAYGFFRSGVEHSLQSLYIWVLINGGLAALGAALALAHPLAVVSAFLAAPLTSLNPMIAAGWVSGLVQAFVHKPTVQDLENLPEAIQTVKGFWRNPLCRILLVVVLSNLGSALGTFIAGSWIAVRSLG